MSGAAEPQHLCVSSTSGRALSLDSFLPSGTRSYGSIRLDRVDHVVMTEVFRALDFRFDAPLEKARPPTRDCSHCFLSAVLSAALHAPIDCVEKAASPAPVTRRRVMLCCIAQESSSGEYARQVAVAPRCTASGTANCVLFWFSARLLGDGVAGRAADAPEFDFCTYPALAAACNAVRGGLKSRLPQDCLTSRASGAWIGAYFWACPPCPQAEGTRCWSQAVQFLREPVAVAAGECVELEACHTSNRVYFRIGKGKETSC